ncbi:MAG: SUMF1/EgtB/PvdO family nonheme iron enzyme [Anaerolineales bacterium]|nr:SUMF1/EgtB/PvdO family nonheme iron enzyme [Anaerolineales bacterium]
MAGNVWEWVYDSYGAYDDSAKTNPSEPDSGNYKVLRGGSWFTNANNTRAASRYYFTPGNRFDDVGFRCVVPPGQ